MIKGSRHKYPPPPATSSHLVRGGRGAARAAAVPRQALRQEPRHPRPQGGPEASAFRPCRVPSPDRSGTVQAERRDCSAGDGAAGHALKAGGAGGEGCWQGGPGVAPAAAVVDQHVRGAWYSARRTHHAARRMGPPASISLHSLLTVLLAMPARPIESSAHDPVPPGTAGKSRPRGLNPVIDPACGHAADPVGRRCRPTLDHGRERLPARRAGLQEGREVGAINPPSCSEPVDGGAVHGVERALAIPVAPVQPLR